MFNKKVNQQIDVDKCVVINESKENLGMKNIEEAMQIAKDAGLDLVLVSESDPAVCVVMDYKKYLYDSKKKIKRQQKKSKDASIKEKEITFGTSIALHDLNIKIKKIKELLEDGCRVKVSCKLYKRQQNQKDRVLDIFNIIYKESKGDQEIPDDLIKSSDNFIYMVINP